MKQYSKSFVIKLSVALVLITAVLSVLASVAVFVYPFGGRNVSGQKAGRIMDLMDQYYLEDYDPELVREGAYYGMALMLGDPYSGYLSEEDLADFEETISGEYVGIGVEVTQDPEDGWVTVISPIDGSPADLAGIRTGDKLVRLNETDLAGKTLDEVVDLLRSGKENEELELEVLRDGASEVLRVVRKKVVIHSVKASMLDEKTGYLKLSSFDDTTLNEFPDALEQLRGQGAEGLVLDLRNNPGGTVESAQVVADLLLDQGVFYYMQDKSGEREYVYTEDGMEDIPMTVLINEGSASASEMLAGALQDRGRAKLVGVTSFGKGIMQEYFPVDAASMLKLTTHEFYTPDGHQINQIGITPDFVTEMDATAEIGDLQQDVQLQKAVSVLWE